MKKVKLTLSINPILLKIAREKKINLSECLEYSLMYHYKLKRVTTIIEEKEYY